jgi:hypothetical protein
LLLWKRCLDLPGFEDVFALDWDRLDPSSVYELVDSIADVALRPVWTASEWRALRAFAPRALDVLASLPRGCRSKATWLLSDVIIYSSESDFAARLHRWAQFMPVAGGGAFRLVDSKKPHMELFDLDDASWATVLAAPPESFVKLNKSAVRQNDAELTKRGLESIIKELPSALASWFAVAPGPLFKSAKALGALSEPERGRLLRELPNHALWGALPSALGLSALVECVQAARAPQSTNPIRRRLRDHFEGRRQLRHEQLRAEHRRLLAAIPSVLLEVLRVRVLERLGAGLPKLPARGGRCTHALMMQRSVGRHRRSLRRVLRSYAAGDRKYLQRHPVNARWMDEHLSALRKRARWLKGVRLTRKTKQGRVTLQIERDPLEALRLGTYTGSCLGLGGDFAYSAVAIVLDANKQVVYARRKGEVIGRQVVALSDARRLVGYEVYGDCGLEPLFKEYDVALAAALGVPIHSPEDDDEDVALLLASRWYDDGAWDVMGSPS